MKIVRHDGAANFLRRAEAWLTTSEAENNIALGVARRFVTEAPPKDTPQYWATVEDRDEVVGCAFRTPPLLLSVTRMPPEATSLLCADLRQFYGELPGVGGPRDTAEHFADAWTTEAGTTWSARTRMLIHELTGVEFPENPPNGELRQVRDAQFALIRSWTTMFVYDTGILEQPLDYAQRLVASKNLFIWEDNGPRCMVAAARETPNGAAVNAVYTPPEHRERGYASAAVAALSQNLLNRGKKFCCLYTDAANPTSNSIYQKVGYRPIREDVDIGFFKVK